MECIETDVGYSVPVLRLILENPLALVGQADPKYQSSLHEWRMYKHMYVMQKEHGCQLTISPTCPLSPFSPGRPGMPFEMKGTSKHQPLKCCVLIGCACLTCNPIGPLKPLKPRRPSSPLGPYIPCWPRGPTSPSWPWNTQGHPTLGFWPQTLWFLVHI